MDEQWNDAWSGTDADSDTHYVIAFDPKTREVLGEFHPDNLADEGLVVLPDNGTYQGERSGSGWYLGGDGFTQHPPEGDGE